jgi:hypothetical protein
MLFSKKTLRVDKSWCLHVFCGLCIQNFVKMLLQALLSNQYATAINPEAGGRYLKEVVQLFTALSSGFDPIMNQDGAQLDLDVCFRKTIFHRKWSSNKTRNSFQYLESLLYTQESPTMDRLKAVIND